MAVVVIGQPNVGKSSVLNRITGSNAMVSNYSGTSVEVFGAMAKIGKQQFEVYDTPGIYSLNSTGEEQETILKLLNQENIELILNIIDASNLERNLVLTYELMELKIPMIVLVNQIDRARSLGLSIDARLLSELLNHPVIFFSAATGEGLQELMEMLVKHHSTSRPVKTSAQTIVLNGQMLRQCGGQCGSCSIPPETCMTIADWSRVERARSTAEMVSREVGEKHRRWLEKVGTFIDRPIIGTVFLLFVAYLGFAALLKFIALSEGPIGAGLEPLNAIIGDFISRVLPPGIVSSVLSQAIPEGLVIPFTIIMPAMLMVSAIMSILEDTGLLPRYSVALERAGSFFGVSGEAVIPLSLGFGCRTPAVLASRIMPTFAQRFIIITLLSIVIPCAATLGILASVIAAFNASLAIIVGTMLLVLMAMGFILSRMMPREETFIYELPPLRIPMWSNLKNKIRMRFAGFFTEVLPLLLVMSTVIRALLESGLLELFVSWEAFTRTLFGIPAEAFVAVLITIFQRYLAPLVLLNLSLTPREATIAISMIALSLPCLPVMVMTVREIGFKGLTKILALGLLTSFSVGIILNFILPV